MIGGFRKKGPILCNASYSVHWWGNMAGWRNVPTLTYPRTHPHSHKHIIPLTPALSHTPPHTHTLAHTTLTPLAEVVALIYYSKMKIVLLTTLLINCKTILINWEQRSQRGGMVQWLFQCFIQVSRASRVWSKLWFIWDLREWVTNHIYRASNTLKTN